MSYIKDKLSEKESAKQTAVRLQQKEKNAVRTERRALRENKKEEKRLEKIDGMLTNIFNRLSTDLDISVNALHRYDGCIFQLVGGANTGRSLLRNCFGLAAKNIGILTTEQIKQNKAYQSYKQVMSDQGFDTDVIEAESAQSITTNKFGTGISASLTATCLMSGFPPIQAIGGAVFTAATLYNVVASNVKTAHFVIQLKEKQPVAMLEHKPVQSDMANLLSQLNKEKVPVEANKKKYEPIIK